MAGTTVNEQNVVYNTLREVVAETGLDISQEEANNLAAGKEKRQAIRDLLAFGNVNVTDSLIEQLYTRFLDLLQRAYADLDVKPMPGSESVFRFLKENDIKVVLNTGYNRETALHLLKKLNWKIGTIIDGLVTASDVERSRPFPDMITLALKQFGIDDPASVVKVGDSVVDIAEGKNAGCGITVGVTTGAQSREMLETASPTYIFDDLGELKRTLMPLLHSIF
jgi:phosphonatase-like hydrolase